MAGKVTELETKLNELFVKNAPKIPENGKKSIVQYAPILSLIIGILTLLSAWTLWNWARVASGVVDYVNQLCATYGAAAGCNTPASRFSVWVWLGLLVLLVEGLLYVLAYSGLKARTKQGWNYLFYGALVNLAYAVVSLFTSYGGVSRFVGALIGSAIGFYFLFQIRDYYLGKKVVEPTVTPKDTTKA